LKTNKIDEFLKKSGIHFFCHSGESRNPVISISSGCLIKSGMTVLVLFTNPSKLNCGAERHHYSMFNVGRSMFDVQLLKQARMP